MGKKEPCATQTKQEAMISFWDANCLRSNLLDLLIAPEAFVVSEDIVLANNKIVKRGTQFFDWDTAEALNSEGKFGNGWRLPTFEEAKYLDGIADLLFRSMQCGYVGPNDMIICRYAPEIILQRLLNVGSMFFWTATQRDDMYAYFAEITSKKILRCNTPMYKSFGLSILCVKDV